MIIVDREENAALDFNDVVRLFDGDKSAEECIRYCKWKINGKCIESNYMDTVVTQVCVIAKDICSECD